MQGVKLKSGTVSARVKALSPQPLLSTSFYLLLLNLNLGAAAKIWYHVSHFKT
jgi:hypothetical protein